ncbi:MAG: hypothetical protein WDN31_07755 [Hyphomicrobium sp.]
MSALTPQSLYRRNEINHIAAETLVRNIMLLMQHQFAHVVRQLVGARNKGHVALSTNAHGDDGDAFRQRGRNLLAYIVPLAALQPGVQHVQPVRSHNGKNDAALRQRLLQFAVEPLTCQEIVDIHEHARAPECRRQRIAYAACIAGRIVAPITDEDTTSHCPKIPTQSNGSRRRF